MARRATRAVDHPKTHERPDRSASALMIRLMSTIKLNKSTRPSAWVDYRCAHDWIQTVLARIRTIYLYFIWYILHTYLYKHTRTQYHAVVMLGVVRCCAMMIMIITRCDDDRWITLTALRGAALSSMFAQKLEIFFPSSPFACVRIYWY